MIESEFSEHNKKSDDAADKTKLASGERLNKTKTTDGEKLNKTKVQEIDLNKTKNWAQNNELVRLCLKKTCNKGILFGGVVVW